MPDLITLGTRGSLLARTQTESVAKLLRDRGAEVRLEVISTRGDTSRDAPIASLGRDGVFVRELEHALLDGRIDLAVHSCKDLPTAETPGLVIAGMPPRANPFDALVSAGNLPLEQLPGGAVVGTSSVRRVAQVRRLRPDLVCRPIRGNIDTRLRKIAEGEVAAVVLAAAGLERLGMAGHVSELLRPDRFWPAVAQGGLALQTRADDAATIAAVIEAADDAATHRAVLAERACLAALAGGCLAPVGAIAEELSPGQIRLSACVLEEPAAGGVRRIVATAERSLEVGGEKSPAEPGFMRATMQELGREVAGMLQAQGADAMLAAARGQGVIDGPPRDPSSFG
jgi:hydroxymethylbilane synthase